VVPFREENPASGEAFELELLTRGHCRPEQLAANEKLAQQCDSQIGWLLRRGPIGGPLPALDCSALFKCSDGKHRIDVLL
jgi:hypothetical protein